MAWVLLYAWLSTSVDAHLEVVATFDNQEHCKIMLEEFSKQRAGYMCMFVTVPPVPKLSAVESFHPLAGQNFHQAVMKHFLPSPR